MFQAGRQRGTKPAAAGARVLAGAFRRWAPRGVAIAAVLACLACAGCAFASGDAGASAQPALMQMATGNGLPFQDEAETLRQDGEAAEPDEDVLLDDEGLDDLGDEVPPEGWEPQGGELAARLDAYLDGNAALTGVPGIAVAVVDAHGVRYMRTMGDCPGTDAPFLIGSLSKSFTALAVMQLAEDGAVDLDAPAALYARAYDVPLDVSVRDLLNQTSGFGYYDSLDQADVGDTYGSFSYANANYDLLGRVVEQVSGEDYASYLRDHVLDPLGMASSSADWGKASALGMAPGHRSWFGYPVADGFVHDSSDAAWGAAPSGYVAASVEDMARYLQMYLRGGTGEDGAQVLSPEGVAAMFMQRVPDPYGDTFYGMGWTSFYWDDGELVLSHDGQVENYVASMCLLPERDMGIVVLGDASDSMGGDALFFQLASSVVAASVGAPPDPIDRSWVDEAHCRADVLYAFCLVCCAGPLLTLCRWRYRLARACGAGRAAAPALLRRERRALAVRGVLLHAALPAAVLALPWVWGVPWRDMATFAPDTAAVLVACAMLLLAGGVAKLALAVVQRRRSRAK